MNIVTISRTFQVVIPRDIRERLELEPGQKVQALAFDHRIEFIPLRPARKMRGFLRGLDTTLDRERDRVTAARRAGASRASGPKQSRAASTIRNA